MHGAEQTVTGTVAVTGMTINCIVGIRPRERANPQPLSVDFEVDYDISAAAGSGDVALAVDYGEAARAVASFVEGAQFGLLETLVAETIGFLSTHLAEGPAPRAIRRIRVTARKPAALDGNGVPSVSAERHYPE